MDQRASNEKSYKIDLYSIPVFLVELAVLAGLAYVAYLFHFQYTPEPFISGFYCDDISYRQRYNPARYTKKFDHQLDMLTIISLLAVAPVLMIIFCELINSLFGSLKFRKIRAMHSCCKLHSITRRTIRFSGAYLLGFFLVMISCDILATSTGRLRPFFAQDCPDAYKACLSPSDQLMKAPESLARALATPANPDSSTLVTVNDSLPPVSESGPAAAPLLMEASSEASRLPDERGSVAPSIVERKWIDLAGKHLDQVCNFAGGDPNVELKFRQLALSWPSYPAALFTYACLFIACYLSFVGTARPVRLITSCLVILFVLVAVVFDVQLVKEHYNHWEDVVSAALLAASVLGLVLYVYLNKFRDFHFYENQKLHAIQARSCPMDASFGNYSAETTLGQYNMNDISNGATNNAMQNDETAGSVTNNDLAMRYFQIPRANFRGAQRPTSAMSSMR